MFGIGERSVYGFSWICGEIITAISLSFTRTITLERHYHANPRSGAVQCGQLYLAKSLPAAFRSHQGDLYHQPHSYPNTKTSTPKSSATLIQPLHSPSNVNHNHTQGWVTQSNLNSYIAANMGKHGQAQLEN